jgi:4-oxalocrotonate tautomerase
VGAIVSGAGRIHHDILAVGLGARPVWQDLPMPIVRVEMWEGRTVAQKRILVRELTEVFARVADCDRASVRIVITDVAKDNWAIGGELQSDREQSA